ncbi:unnamed protein product [Caenorhabditis bovis]|uniref:Uncharacterized protein n=1 Tax=Caenorhabditis bovis TaxID=2654633 RepID=A0A8S1EHH4_9PELO|nr:unnamed protein product [Caenorhabditis bovis]
MSKLFRSIAQGYSSNNGAEWTPTIRFISYDENGDVTRTPPIEADDLLEFFDEQGASAEVIVKAKIWKHQLFDVFPAWFGLWHEYIVVETTNWFWSFEKFSCSLFVQRSRRLDDVLRRIAGKSRKPERPEGRWDDDVRFGETIQNVIEWILNTGKLETNYDTFKSNCHFFASLLYEAITRTKKFASLSVKGSSKSVGGQWQPKITFVSYRGNTVAERLTLCGFSNILEFGKSIGIDDEAIIGVEKRTHNLFRGVPSLGLLYHEFIILKAISWNWSIEKNSDGILVQRAKTADVLYDNADGIRRTSRTSSYLSWRNYDDCRHTINHVFQWLLNNEELKRTYHLFEDNCQIFAARLHQAILNELDKFVSGISEAPREARIKFASYGGATEMKTSRKADELVAFYDETNRVDERIDQVKLWRHPMPSRSLFDFNPPSHEFITIKTGDVYYSFDKYPDALYIQKSADEKDVLAMVYSKPRPNREHLVADGRYCTKLAYNESVRHIIEWIVNTRCYENAKIDPHTFGSSAFADFAICRPASNRRRSSYWSMERSNVIAQITKTANDVIQKLGESTPSILGLDARFVSSTTRRRPTVHFVAYRDGLVSRSDELTLDETSKFVATHYDADDARIVSSKIWKTPFFAWFPPIFCVWHEFVIVESSSNRYWSFEKHDYTRVIIQTSTRESDVRHHSEGVGRHSPTIPEGRHCESIAFNETIVDCVEWIRRRHTKSAAFTKFCHHFASLLYEAINRQKGRRLDDD